MVYRNDLKYLVDNLPPSVLAERLPYLRFGASQLPVAQRQEFEMLVALATSSAQTPVSAA